MAWLRVDDASPTHPRVLRLAALDDERQLNEAWGWLLRCAAHSAGYYTDGFVSEQVAAEFAGGRVQVLVKAARGAGLLSGRTRHPETGERGWQILLDADDLLHIRLKDEVEWERRHRQQLRDPEVYIPVRRRDGDGCRYCGRIVSWTDRKSARAGTLDHVDPDGDELVVSCKGCNSKKQARTLEQAGMALLPPPSDPHYSRHTSALLSKHGTPRPGGQPDPAPRPGAQPDPAPDARPGLPPGTAASTTAMPAEQPAAPRGSSADLAPPALPDLVLPGRDGTGALSPTRARDGPRRGSRGRRGRARPA